MLATVSIPDNPFRNIETLVNLILTAPRRRCSQAHGREYLVGSYTVSLRTYALAGCADEKYLVYAGFDSGIGWQSK